MNITDYKTIVFDCDGVVLDSNKVKTDAFYKAALPYGEEKAQSLVQYHVARGGVSRYKKFEWLLELCKGIKGPTLEQLLASYAKEVEAGLLSCNIAKGLKQLRAQTKSAKWLIVSGGAQYELRDIFAKRNIDSFYNGGIFGSPDSKDEILSREIANGNIVFPALFLGDSKYDFEAASRASLDFVFLSRWTEVKFWETWTESEGIKNYDSISLLI
ncbi:MAG: phosphoglycolate phosphatase-like HAD superfamily hydrolase [Pseudoalteromonas distincta]|jgi:phosphoglycolate phosphatase-like HAD superfamily hydrolase